jgi:hypothetical protein
MLENDTEILFMDDWCLSGISACTTLEHLLYKRDITSILYTFVFYLITDEGTNSIKRLINNVDYDIISYRSIDRFDLILVDIGDKAIVDFHKIMCPDTEDFSYPVVSDYKIPNQFGSYPLVYSEIYSIDRSFMKDIIERWTSLVIQ